jgi:hypothetical protein
MNFNNTYITCCITCESYASMPHFQRLMRPLNDISTSTIDLVRFFPFFIFNIPNFYFSPPIQCTFYVFYTSYLVV